MNQRRNKRYYLRGRVHFSWTGADQVPHKGEGTTRDISVTGVYVHTSDMPPIGSAIHLEVGLPSFRGEGEGIQLRNQGFVVRAESGGFAALADLDFGSELERNEATKGTALDAPERSGDGGEERKSMRLLCRVSPLLDLSN